MDQYKYKTTLASGLFYYFEKKKKKKESESRSVVSNFCDPMDCSPLGSFVHGILQASILEWVAFPFSRGFKLW